MRPYATRFWRSTQGCLRGCPGCGISDDSGSPGRRRVRRTAHGGKSASCSSNAGSAGTTKPVAAPWAVTGTGGQHVDGMHGSPEAGAGGMAEAACGDGKVEAGEECDDGEHEGRRRLLVICTTKCEQCEVAANCRTK